MIMMLVGVEVTLLHVGLCAYQGLGTKIRNLETGKDRDDARLETAFVLNDPLPEVVDEHWWNDVGDLHLEGRRVERR
jgi:hypothetical protein